MHLSKLFELVIIILCFFPLVQISESPIRTLLRSKMSKLLDYASAVQECHYYRKYWQLKQSQSLDCVYEKDNEFDLSAIKVMDQDAGATAGHLPMETLELQNSSMT